jgi:hypothetical protein
VTTGQGDRFLQVKPAQNLFVLTPNKFVTDRPTALAAICAMPMCFIFYHSSAEGTTVGILKLF